jgi:hypothetical protein
VIIPTVALQACGVDGLPVARHELACLDADRMVMAPGEMVLTEVTTGSV